MCTTNRKRARVKMATIVPAICLVLVPLRSYVSELRQGSFSGSNHFRKDDSKTVHVIIVLMKVCFMWYDYQNRKSLSSET